MSRIKKESRKEPKSILDLSSEPSSYLKKTAKTSKFDWFVHYSIFPNRALIIAFLALIDTRFFITTFFSVGFTLLCLHFEYGFQTQSLFFSSPVAIPIAFMINNNFMRRERSLDAIAIIREQATSILINFRSMSDLYDFKINALTEIVNRIYRVLNFTTAYLITNKKKEKLALDKAIMEDISDIVYFSECFHNRKIVNTRVDLYRIYENIELLLLNIETLKTISDNPPPKSLMIFSKITLFLLPIIYAPFFVRTNTLSDGTIPWYTPIIYSVVLSYLASLIQNLHKIIENIFSGYHSQVKIKDELLNICIDIKHGVFFSEKPAVLNTDQEQIPINST